MWEIVFLRLERNGFGNERKMGEGEKPVQTGGVSNPPTLNNPKNLFPNKLEGKA